MDGRHTETARAVPGEVTQGRARRPRPADCRSAEMTRHGTGAAVRRELVDPTSSWTSTGAHGGPGVTISAETSEMHEGLEEMIAQVSGADGVLKFEILAG